MSGSKWIINFNNGMILVFICFLCWINYWIPELSHSTRYLPKKKLIWLHDWLENPPKKMKTYYPENEKTVHWKSMGWLEDVFPIFNSPIIYGTFVRFFGGCISYFLSHDGSMGLVFLHTFTKKKSSKCRWIYHRPMDASWVLKIPGGIFPVCHVSELRGFSKKPAHHLLWNQATPGHATGVDAPLSTTTWAATGKGRGAKRHRSEKKHLEIQPKVDVKHIIWTYLVFLAYLCRADSFFSFKDFFWETLFFFNPVDEWRNIDRNKQLNLQRWVFSTSNPKPCPQWWYL